MSNVICTGSDTNYLKYIHAFARSAKSVDTQTKIVCRLVNVNVDNIIDNDNMSYIIDNLDLSEEAKYIKHRSSQCMKFYLDAGTKSIKEIKNLAKLLYSEQAAYTCHSRFKTILEMMNSGYKNILCLDADTIIKRNIDHLFVDIEHDLSIITETEHGVEQLFHNEGLLLINVNPVTRKYFEQVHEYIFSGDRYTEWDVDSEAMSYVYNRMKNDMTINKLPRSYKCKEHLDESHMWSGCGLSKDKLTFASEVSSIR